MKLRHTNQIELSVSNLRALLEDIEDRERDGRKVSTMIYRTDEEGRTLAVSVVADKDHYTEIELEYRAWAGAR